MTTWSPPELNAVFGCTLGEVDATEIEALVTDEVEETNLLDFKTDYHPHEKSTGWTERHELAKDVASFANAQGGVVIIGITERDKKAAASKPLIEPTSEVKERWVFQAIRNYVSPLPAVDVRSVHGDDGYWVLVIVPPSLDSPHAVTGPQGDGKLSFPRRHGSDTLWLTEHEVADAYRQRFSGQDALAANRERVIAAELKALEASEDMWLWVCALADRPAAGRLDTATAAAIDAWWDGGDVTPLGRSIGRGDSLPAPGRLTFPDFAWSHDDVLNPRARFTELHVDGTAFSASAIGWLTSDNKSEAKPLGEFTLVDEIVALVDVTVRWCTHRVGATGTATVVCGLTDLGGDRRSIELVGDQVGGLRRMSFTRRHQPPVDLRVETAVDLAAVGTTQQRLVICHHLISGVLQWFGRVAPDQIRPDGSINTRAWRDHDHREVERWATARDVDFTSPGAAR